MACRTAGTDDGSPVAAIATLPPVTLTPRERQAYELGWLESQDASAKALAARLRATAAAARKTQAPGLVARLRAALLWELTEAWCGRLEQLAAELEHGAAGIAAERQRRHAELAPPEGVPAPAAAAAPRPPRPRKKR